MERQMVRREEGLNPNVTYGPVHTYRPQRRTEYHDPFFCSDPFICTLDAQTQIAFFFLFWGGRGGGSVIV